MYHLVLTVINGVIQGQDYSDNDVFSSVVISNVCVVIVVLY